MKLRENISYRTFASMLAMLVGIGLVRYSYSPLIPSMLDGHWIDAAQAGYLGTINFAGNLVGALICARLAGRFSPAGVCRWSLVLGFASVIASAWEVGFAWLMVTRFLAGLTAAGTMILAPVVAAAGAPAEARGRIIGFVFAGAGIGVIGLSLLLPLFLADGPTGGWLFTAALVAVCSLVAWPGLRGEGASTPTEDGENPSPRSPRLAIWLLAVAYALAAVGIVPHSIYLSAYVHQALGMPVSFSTLVFAIYGVGVLLGGPLLGGQLALRLGTWAALVLSTVLALTAVALVLLTTDVGWVVASGGLLGMAQMGIASITSHRVIELAGPAGHTRWWGTMTVGFNVGQAGGALAMGSMLHIHWGYLAGFGMAAICLTVSAVLALLAREKAPHATDPGDRHGWFRHHPLPH